MLPMRQHRGIEVKSVKHVVVKMSPLASVDQDARMLAADVLASCDQEPRCTAGRITDRVILRGRHHLDHELNDVPWCAELTVDASARDLA